LCGAGALAREICNQIQIKGRSLRPGERLSILRL